MKLTGIIISSALLILGAGCTFADTPRAQPRQEIHSYEECVTAGFKTTRMLPPQCITDQGKIFVKGLSAGESKGERLCKNLCGDGTCASIVCMGEGCPCPENPITCPEDCRQNH